MDDIAIVAIELSDSIKFNLNPERLLSHRSEMPCRAIQKEILNTFLLMRFFAKKPRVISPDKEF